MILTAPKVAKNDPSRKGQFASKQILFGDNSRYSVYAVHTRFESVIWFVADAEQMVDTGYGTRMPEIVRQGPTFEAAVEGLST